MKKSKSEIRYPGVNARVERGMLKIPTASRIRDARWKNFRLRLSFGLIPSIYYSIKNSPRQSSLANASISSYTMDIPQIMPSIFSIELSTVTRQSLATLLLRNLQKGEQTTIATVNPEILLHARGDVGFRNILKACTLRVIDGFGISFVHLIKRGKMLPRMTGWHVVSILLRLACDQQLTVGVVGGTSGVSGTAVRSLQAQYPTLRIIDLSNGENIRVSTTGEILEGARQFEDSIKAHRPHIILLGLGAPKQEFLMQSLIRQYPWVRITVGIGGILDVLAKKIRPVPLAFSRLGLEWLWRLLQEPRRFTRIIRAVIVFPIAALLFDSRKYEKT